MKIDVEGAEVGVLNGAKSLFAKCKPVIFLSLHGDELKKTCMNLLERIRLYVPTDRANGDRGSALRKNKALPFPIAPLPDSSLCEVEEQEFRSFVARACDLEFHSSDIAAPSPALRALPFRVTDPFAT